MRHGRNLAYGAGGLLLALALTACISSGLRPRTGDISFRLLWTGEADLDLYVTSPLGERVDFLRRSVASGGKLDVDCNVREIFETHVCAEPMENIFWPPGRAPHGRYECLAVIANEERLHDTDQYRIEVRLGRRIVAERSGLIVDLRDRPPFLEIEFPGGKRR